MTLKIENNVELRM